MTKEKQARLEFIDKEGISSDLTEDIYDFQWLITELKSAWAREAELVKALENAVEHLEIHGECPTFRKALAQHKASLEDKQKENIWNG